MDETFQIPFNFSAPDEHVGDIERSNRVLGERYWCEYHCSPFDLFPRQLICGLMARCAFNKDHFIKEGGCSNFFHHTIYCDVEPLIMRNIYFIALGSMLLPIGKSTLKTMQISLSSRGSYRHRPGRRQ